MKKILFHINSLGKGGAERVMSNLANCFVEDGYEIILTTQWKEKDEYQISDKVKRIHVGLQPEDEKKGRLYKLMKRYGNLRNVIKEQKPDLILAFSKNSNFRAILAALGLHIPVVVSERSDPNFQYKGNIQKAKGNILYRIAAGNVFQTEYARDFFNKSVQKKSTVIFNPLHEKYIKVTQSKQRKKEIVTVGRISEVKNQKIMIEAFLEVRKIYPEYKFKIYGEDTKDGTYEILKNMVEAADAKDSILFMGNSDTLEDAIKDATLFMLTSLYEGMPNALMEAMAMGIPCIATDCPCGGSYHLLNKDKCGILIKNESTKELIDAILHIIEHPEEAEYMGEKAMYVKEEMHPQKIYQEWLKYLSAIKKKKIVFYLSRLTKGGTERVVVNLAEYFYKRGWDVTLATTHKMEDEFQYSEGIQRVITEVTSEELSSSRVKNVFLRIRKLRHILKNYDIAVSFIGKNNIMAIIATFFTKTATYVAVRGEPKEEYYNKLLRICSKVLFIFADGIVMQTTSSKSYFPKYLQKKIEVIGNSIHPSFLEVEPCKTRRKRIVTVGRIDQNKNHIMLIKAFELLPDKLKEEYKVEIYGTSYDDTLQHLHTYCNEHGLSNSIVFKGQTSNVAEEIKDASVFVLTSNTEGMPNALIEAMTVGVPSISTNCPCGGPADLIENGRNGILVPVNDWKELSKQLERIVEDKIYLENLAKNGRKIIEKLHPDLVNKKWEEYFTRK